MGSQEGLRPLTQNSTDAGAIPRYRYSPLPQGINTIRLFRLLPGKQQALRGEIFEYTLNFEDTASYPYEALSYRWGSGENPNSINIRDDQKLDRETEVAVTQNLHAALRHLRDGQISRIFWIDAICIDQANTKEKESQIPLMAAIYAKASRVLVWLGEARDDSDQALDTIRMAAKGLLDPYDSSTHKAVQKLLSREWFFRCWVRSPRRLYISHMRC